MRSGPAAVMGWGGAALIPGEMKVGAMEKHRLDKWFYKHGVEETPEGFWNLEIRPVAEYPDKAKRHTLAWFEMHRRYYCRSALFHIGSPCAFCGYVQEEKEK